MNLSARLVMPERGQDVWIVDMSAHGVAIEAIKPLTGSSGLLMWLDFKQVIDLVWHDGLRCGFRFSQPLDPQVLQKSLAEGAVKAEPRLRAFAQ